MTFGEYLKQLRESRALNQSDLAASINVSTVYICDIEKNRRNPPDIEKLRVWIRQLALSPKETAMFYDLAGVARGTPAPDVMEYLCNTPQAIASIRLIMSQGKEYTWNNLPKMEIYYVQIINVD